MKLYAWMMLALALVQCGVWVLLTIHDRAADRLFLHRLALFCGMIVTSAMGIVDLVIGL